MKKDIYIACCGEYGKHELPPLSTVVEDVYTVVTCPVCGKKTLDYYYVCEECGWEYDGRSDDEYSSANKTTLKEYRNAYLNRMKGEYDER